MIIDIIFIIILLMAFIHGYKKGIIHSIVSLIILVIGIIAAVRLSEIAAVYLDRWFDVASRYLPLISFIVVFIGIILLFRLLEKVLEGFFKMLKLNFINQLIGAMVWCVIWIMLYSTLLFYINNMGLISEAKKNESVTYEKIAPFAPQTIALVGKIIPPVQNTFNNLKAWFDNLELHEPSEVN